MSPTPDRTLADPQKVIANLRRQLAEAQRRLDEALAEREEAQARETATAEVLQVINASPGDLAPVFDAMLEKAMRLCGAAFGQLGIYDGDVLSLGAVRGPPDIVSYMKNRGPVRPIKGHNSTIERLARGENVIHVADAKDDDAYREGNPNRRALVDLGGCRTLLNIALRKDRRLLGAIEVYRQEVHPFSDKQIALLQNFAAQAVIAMENARLITETREALDQQTATAEVLQVINSSPGDLVPVFDAMLEKALSLCEASLGMLYRFDGEAIHLLAVRGASEAALDLFRRPVLIEPESAVGGMARGEAEVIHNPDVMDDEIYRSGVPSRLRLVELTGARTAVWVALRKDEALQGVFVIYRQEVRPFSDKQIALLQNFAAQAVIAMENARLITETREALDQQTATAEVLGVINSSPGDLAPVFDAMLEKAMRLCDAAFGIFGSFDGEFFHNLAQRGVPAAFAEALRQPIPPTPGGAFYQVLHGEPVVQVVDLAADEPYRSGRPAAVALVDLAGARTAVYVALRKEEVLLGVFIIFRQEVRPFTDKQIALLQNFAAQAVIAMENARLVTETREALDQQTATAEVLQVINVSPGDLAPVFEAMLDKAMRLCDAAFGLLAIFDHEQYRTVASRGVPPGLAEFLTHPLPVRPGTMPNRILLHGDDILQNPDMAAATVTEPREAWPPGRTALVELGGARSTIWVALRKDGVALGFFAIYRQEVRPFAHKQIALLQNFAVQAVIAMENARLLTETQEALEQQTATAEVLGVINSSPGDLAPVFEAILDKAHTLCGTSLGQLMTFDGELIHSVAARGLPEDLADLAAQPFPPGPAMSTLIRGESPFVHLREVRAGDSDTSPTGSPPIWHAWLNFIGAGTYLVVPLRKDDRIIGFINAFRDEIRPFSDKEIALLQNFAAQAVIAMENARLITETQEALEQQTATAEVLGVINSSPGDLAPVFEAMLEKALSLCQAAFGVLRAYDGKYFNTLAVRGREISDSMPMPVDKGSALERIVQGERVVHIPDLVDTDAYRAGVYSRRYIVDVVGARTAIWVALRKDDAVLGDFVIHRKEVRPFSDKQISLLQNFAAQAVIAMENARLITETREARDDAEAALGHLKAAQANLIQAEKMASLGQLTAGIAHEIKNPLNFVNNFASLSVELLDELKETTAPALATLDEAKRADADETIEMLSGNLEKIAEHGKRADNIVKSMLEHSRGVSGERREIDLNNLIEEALNLAYHGARAQDQSFNISLERDFAPTLTPIELAPQELTRVFLNLFGNGFYAANKRAKENGNGSFRPILRVATHDLGDAVEVRVRDNGTGIPPEIKDKLFQPFFTTKPTGEGTGLGLSISYDIVVQQHGGSIEVDSEVGEYTEFTVRLPRHQHLSPSGTA